MIGPRRAAREAALVILFGAEVGRVTDADEALRSFHDHLGEDPEVLEELFGDDEEGPTPGLNRIRRVLRDDGSQWPFVERIVHGVFANQAAIDDLITRCSLNWKLGRMTRVDRNVLRMAAYELAFEPDVPGRATLNEAIELAKRYGTEDSGKFVNGILDRIAQDLERV